MTRHDVAFETHDAVTLRGWLYRPAGVGPCAGVVMAHGFSATKEMGIDDHAASLAAAGYAVLLYDHRALGESDGTPRQLIDPFVQTRDMMAAIGWLAAQPEIDASRIALWGTSYSGGEALILAAIDPRVRAAAVIVPFVGNPAAAPPHARAALTALAERIVTAEIDAQSVTGPRAVVPASDALPVVLMPDPDTGAWMLAARTKSHGRWENAVFGASRPGDLTFDPAVALADLSIPVLMIAGSEDRVIPVAAVRAAAALAGPVVELVVLPGHHCTFYEGDGLTVSSRLIRDFFARSL